MYQLKGSLLNDVLVPALSKFDRFIKNSFFIMVVLSAGENTVCIALQ
jgi:hypothetical protein